MQIADRFSDDIITERFKRVLIRYVGAKRCHVMTYEQLAFVTGERVTTLRSYTKEHPPRVSLAAAVRILKALPREATDELLACDTSLLPVPAAPDEVAHLVQRSAAAVTEVAHVSLRALFDHRVCRKERVEIATAAMRAMPYVHYLSALAA